MDLSRERPLSNGVTEACLNLSGNLPSEKDRLAKCAMKTVQTKITKSSLGCHKNSSFLSPNFGPSLRTGCQRGILR